MKILLTGATGFIGSHIARTLVAGGHRVLILKRENSSLLCCSSIISQIETLNRNDLEWENKAAEFSPDTIIHAAWIGVTALERDDYDLQEKNIPFIDSLLRVAERCTVKKIIGLGSQAEYGSADSVLTEEMTPHPVNAYGKTKLKVLNRIRNFSQERKITWYWFRIFSVFGGDQPRGWLIPDLVHDLLFSPQRHKDFTLGEQIYSYLDVSDLTQAISKSIEKEGRSGIYNLTSRHRISIRELVTRIRNKIDKEYQLNFGALPYRKHQPMLVVGSPEKFIKTFSEFEQSSIEKRLPEIIDYQRTLSS